MPTTRRKADVGEIQIPETDIGEVSTGILGITPYIHNRLAEKARHELLYPKGRPNAAAKASRPKHDPVEEFRASPYRLPGDEDVPTLLATMGSMFKGAMMTAAMDIPGVQGTQIGRLVTVEGHYLPLWGSCSLYMAVTRSADKNHTPDIRTRAISPEWGTIITVSFVRPLLNHQTIINLLATAGRSAGVGDYRPQKGKGTFGQFQLVHPDDERLKQVMKLDRAVQQDALEAAEPWDPESAELLAWYLAERTERGQ